MILRKDNSNGSLVVFVALNIKKNQYNDFIMTTLNLKFFMFVFFFFILLSVLSEKHISLCLCLVITASLTCLNKQLLQLCMARTAWSNSDQAVRAVHSCNSWWLGPLWSDSVINLVSVLFGKCTTLVVMKCWPCSDQWKAEKLGTFWRWPVTRCVIESDRAGLIIEHSINFRLNGEHWRTVQFAFVNFSVVYEFKLMIWVLRPSLHGYHYHISDRKGWWYK